MSTAPLKIDARSASAIGAAYETEAKLSTQGKLALQLKSTISVEVQDLIDDLKDLYGEPSPRLGQVLTLLTEAIEASRQAIEYDQADDRLRADEKMLTVQALVSELLGFRGIGDAFGIVIGALTFSFINKGGLPFKRSEIFAVLKALNAIRLAPFGSTENAIPITEVLEDAGLIVDPIPLSALLSEAQEAGLVES